jgi:hypothetical protein
LDEEYPCLVPPQTGCFPDEEFLELLHSVQQEQQVLPERPEPVPLELLPLVHLELMGSVLRLPALQEQQVLPVQREPKESELKVLPALLSFQLLAPQMLQVQLGQLGQPLARPRLALRLGMPHEAF